MMKKHWVVMNEKLEFYRYLETKEAACEHAEKWASTSVRPIIVYEAVCAFQKKGVERIDFTPCPASDDVADGVSCGDTQIAAATACFGGAPDSQDRRPGARHAGGFCGCLLRRGRPVALYPRDVGRALYARLFSP